MRLATIPGAAIAFATLLFATAVWAADDPRIAPGAPVLGADGRTVGTVEEVQDKAVVVNTGKHLAPISIQSVERLDNGLTINATQADINRMMDEQIQQASDRRDEFLARGRLVRSVDMQPVGRIVAIEDSVDSVVILRNEGVIALKREHFAVMEDNLVALFTSEQINENTKPVPEALRQKLSALSVR